jgi:hypothetical protein
MPSKTALKWLLRSNDTAMENETLLRASTSVLEGFLLFGKYNAG